MMRRLALPLATRSFRDVSSRVLKQKYFRPAHRLCINHAITITNRDAGTSYRILLVMIVKRGDISRGAILKYDNFQRGHCQNYIKAGSCVERSVWRQFRDIIMMHGLHPRSVNEKCPWKHACVEICIFYVIYASQCTLHRSLVMLNTLPSVLVKMIVFILLEAFCARMHARTCWHYYK